MPAQIQDGLQNMSLNANHYRTASTASDAPNFSPFPKLHNPPPNVPPSDEELEATLENARTMVLSSNDPEMQLAWAADALVYVSVSADHEERIASANPQKARAATPRIEHQLKQDAMNIVTFLADQHHPKAEFLRGQWLEWGRFNQREDKKEAFRCYSRAADRGYARAEYRIGMLYESYNDPIKALRHYHRGMEAGDAASCYRLGMMTLRGQHGQQLDYAKGADLIRRSAQNADENAAQGAYVYGMLLSRQLPQLSLPDEVLPYDERGARVNIEKAAYLKFAKAQLKMGSLYELGGLGCEFNPALSMHYNALASRQGEAEADMALSKWFLVGSEGIFPKNEDLAYTYAERAAQAGLATAEFAMGYFNEIGMKVPVDLDQAMFWYEKASKHGNEDAGGRIEGLKKRQVLSRKDHENVAIKRITSMYGSQRGGRPARFEGRQQRPGQSGLQMSSVPEQQFGYGTPPPTANSYGRSSAGGAVQAPPRDSSTTPCPVDDRPPTVPPPDNRSASAAPYPLEDGPPNQAAQRVTPRPPVGGFFNAQPPPQRPATTVAPDMRPSSAFQFNPDVRSNSTMTLPQLPSQGGPGAAPYPPTMGRGGPGPRPMAAQPLRPHDPNSRPGGQRVPSGPVGMQQQFNPGQPRPSPGPQAMTPPAHTGSPRPNMPPQQGGPGPGAGPGKLDIGFSAPQNDRRNRTYGPQPGTGAPQSTPKPQSPAMQQSSSMPNFNNTQTDPMRAGTPSSRPGSARPPADARSRLPSQGGGGGATPKPPQKESSAGGAPSGAPAVPESKPTTAPTSSAGAGSGAKPPGKGPKTFDEMGVPAQKQDSDCVVM